MGIQKLAFRRESTTVRNGFTIVLGLLWIILRIRTTCDAMGVIFVLPPLPDVMELCRAVDFGI